LAGESGTAAHPLIRRLETDPYGFDFFLAVRLLDCAHPHLPRTGHSDHPWEDHVRFSQEPSLAFAPATVQGLRRPAPAETEPLPPGELPPGEHGSEESGGDGLAVGEDGRALPNAAPRLFQNFFGLLGPNGPMPHHITEYARDRERNYGDPTLARFLDLLNHRLTALFYRAWASAQKTVSFDRPAEDRYAPWIGSLFGFGTPALRGRDSVQDFAKLHYAGHLVCQTRHASGLRAIIEDYFGVKTKIQEMSGQWMDLPEDCRLRLGESPATGTLGSTAVVGSRIWECQQKFRLRMGPMTLAEYERLLPGGTSLKRLTDWVRFYTTDEFTWDLRLIMFADEVPQITLGKQGKLGWTTWLRSKPLGHDADDLILRPTG